MARRKQRGHTGTWIAAAIGTGLFLAGSHSAHLHLPHIPLHLDAISAAPDPSAGQRRWARALLRAGHLPVTACNVGAVSAWEAAEGGHWANSAEHNPLNTTMTEPGSWPMPGSTNIPPVRAYPTWRTGLRATVATLNDGYYPRILAALSDGGSAQAVADAVASSRWGTGSFQASC
jgi:hypothetical protein